MGRDTENDSELNSSFLSAEGRGEVDVGEVGIAPALCKDFCCSLLKLRLVKGFPSSLSSLSSCLLLLRNEEDFETSAELVSADSAPSCCLCLRKDP